METKPTYRDEAVDTDASTGMGERAESSRPHRSSGRDGSHAGSDATAAASTAAEPGSLTKARARDLGLLLYRYIRRYLPPPAPHKPASETPQPPALTGVIRLHHLRVIPWLLGAIFLLSFAWDFTGITLELFGRTLPLEGLLRVLSVSGFIGFFTNWLAITMLFKPRRKRPIFGQGLIPAQRERVIFRLAQAISQELINESVIKERIEESGAIQRYRETALKVSREVIEDPGFRKEVKELTAAYIDEILQSPDIREKLVRITIARLEHYAGKGLSGLALRAYTFFKQEELEQRIDSAIRELPGKLDTVLDEMDRFLDILPEKIEARSGDMELWATRAILGFVETLDIYDMVTSNMRKFDEARLESLLKNTSNEHFNYIKYLGGILGFFGGLIIWNPVLALAVFGIFGGTLYLIDESLFRRKGLRAG